MITGNIRGLNPGIHYSKIEYLKDLAFDRKACIISLTESHLSKEISNEELKFENWTITRADRNGRYGGGVMNIVRDNLTISDEKSGSDSMTEYLCTYI